MVTIYKNEFLIVIFENIIIGNEEINMSVFLCTAMKYFHASFYEKYLFLKCSFEDHGLIQNYLFLFGKVLCELFQSAPQRGNVPVSGNISGFIRRLFLQLMLEDEKVTVFLQSPCPVHALKIPL